MGRSKLGWFCTSPSCRAAPELTVYTGSSLQYPLVAPQLMA